MFRPLIIEAPASSDAAALDDRCPLDSCQAASHVRPESVMMPK